VEWSSLKYLPLVKGAVSHHNGLFFLRDIVCVHIIMPTRTQQQQLLLQQIAVHVGVPVTEQQGNNGLSIVGTRGLAGQMTPTPSQPFTVNATPVSTIVNVGGNGGGSSGGGGNGSGGSITSSTTRSSNTSTRLPTADIRLMSPQSYHQQWGEYSLVGKVGVLMNLWCPDGKPSHVLEFQLDEHSNTPTVVNVSCTAEEWETIGPYLRSSCARHSLAFNTHGQAPVFECEHNFDTNASLFPLVAGPSYVNLTPGQKELLLWHWRLGISM
jgi:hypothetical protein